MGESKGRRKLKAGLDILKSIRLRRIRRFGAGLECARLLREIAGYLHLPFEGAAARSYHRRIKAWLAAEYADVLDAWRTPPEAAPGCAQRRIWTYWHQGMDGAPEIIRRCVDSMDRNRGDAALTVVSIDRLPEYVALDDVTREKLAAGAISVTELSNYVRLSLLYEYGGLWMDAGTWVNHPLAPHFPEIFDRPFYSICRPDPKNLNASQGRWTTYLMAAPPRSPIAGFTRDMYLAYFHREDMLVDYFLFDCILALGYDSFPWFRELVDGAPRHPEFRVFRLHGALRGSDRAALDAALRDPDQLFYKLTYKLDYLQSPEG